MGERSYTFRMIFLVFILCSSLTAFANMTGLSPKLIAYVEKNFGGDAADRLRDWQELIDDSRNIDEDEKLKVVNDFFNENEFVSDMEHWGVEDYWATPVEMLITQGGDCEDFSIGKYFTLRELGVPDKKMLIMYVNSLELNQAHMVLTYYKTPNAEPIVLDNLREDILPASERDDLVPVYSFNGEGLWLSKERGRGRRVGSAARLSLWTDLASRLKKGIVRY